LRCGSNTYEYKAKISKLSKEEDFMGQDHRRAPYCIDRGHVDPFKPVGRWWIREQDQSIGNATIG
jgi:hypothetical protein